MTTKPSSNWFALQKSLVQHRHPRKRRKVERSKTSVSPPDERSPNTPSLSLRRHESDNGNSDIDLETAEVKNGEPIAALRRMVLGKIEYKAGSQTAPGKYIALDCEMVGVGIDGKESSLARVSIVNYAGAIILDIFVRQRERVVDYRTQWSGVRSTDLAGAAKPFKEVQQMVAGLIKDRVLVGHAIHNDLKALLLSHPSTQIRDTQSLAYKHHVVKSRHPALRVVVKQELGIVIQGGEHSSVTDARATMALFRLHKKQWESGFRSFRTVAHPRTRDDPAAAPKQSSTLSPSSSSATGRKRGHSESSRTDDSNMAEAAEARSTPSLASSATLHPIPLPKRRRPIVNLGVSANSSLQTGISSGISTVIRRADGVKEVSKGTRAGIGPSGDSVVGSRSGGKRQRDKAGDKWWISLGGSRKGSVRL